MEYLTTVDYIILVLLAIGGIWGAIKGFIDEFSSKCGYVMGLLVAFMFTASLAKLFAVKFNFPYWFAAFLAYFIIFMVGYSVVRGLGTVIDNIFEASKLDVVDHLLGFFLGLVEALLFLGLIEYALNFQNLFNVQGLFNDSFISSRLIMPVFNWVGGLVNNTVGDLV